jgi:hypothetical protein
MEGDPLDVQQLLWTPEGKPRMSILYIAHLSESERMFFVTLLLNEIIAWMRKQSGTSSLRALLYMDEVFGYFPPTANPPSKKPMLTLLKQARAFGLGVVLATQNPVDLDYKGLSNAGTWLIGRMQTERDVARVLDGLEGAATAAGGTFDRRDMERTIAGLDKRVFLMNNVHEDEPVLFRTRWVLSYLRGPLTRDHVRTLMQEKKAKAKQARTTGIEAGIQQTAAAKPLEGKPVVPASITQSYLLPNERMLPEEHVLYKPAISGSGRLHYVKSAQDIDHWKEITALAPLSKDTVEDPWAGSLIIPGELDLDSEGDDKAAYDALPGEAAQPKNYKPWKTALKNYLYREHKLDMFECKELKMMSQPGETKGDFLIRLREAAHEKRDIEVQKLRTKYEKKLKSMQNKIFTAQEGVEREKSQYKQQKLQTAISIGATLIGSMFGKRRGSSWTTAARGAGRAVKDREDIKRRKEKLMRLQQDFARLQQQMEKDLSKLKAEIDVESFELTQTELASRKADITVSDVQLVWVPWFAGLNGSLRQAVVLQ